MSRLKDNRKKAYTEQDWDMVIKYGELEFKQHPQSIKILNDLAIAYFNKKDYDNALICCDKIQETVPTDDLKVLSDKYSMRYMRYNEVLGEIYYLQGKDKEALEVFDRLKVLGPYFSKKYSLTAAILIRQKNYKGAAKEYADMLTHCPRHFQTATNGLLDLVDIDPLNEATFTTLFHIYSEAKDIQNVIVSYESMRKKGMASKKFLYILIHMYSCTGKYDEAMKVAQEEIVKQPDNPYLHIFLSRVYQSLMEFSKAKICIKKASALDKQHEERYRSFYDVLNKNLRSCEKKLLESINMHLKDKQCLDAIRDSEQLLRNVPDNKSYQTVFLKVIEKSISIFLAEENIEEAVMLTDRLVTLKEKYPHVPVQVEVLKKRVADKRITVYEDMISREKFTGDQLNRVRYELANIYLAEAKDYDRGIALLKDVAEAGGQYGSDSHYLIAQYLLENKDLETAEIHVQEYSKISCTDDRVKSKMYDLGAACERAGLKHQARGLFNKISASDSNFKDVKNRINTLKQSSGSGREIPEAVMVVDICESSRMMDLYGDGATYLIKNALEGIMFPIFKDNKSSFTKSTGDGFLVCFPNQKGALNSAIQILESINTYNSGVGDGPQIHLRFGIHFGEVRVMPDGDRHGTNINIPFRVEGLKGDDLVVVKDGISREEFTLIDRIFITEALYTAVLNKGNFNIRYLGLFELRNITGMHKIYQVMTGNEK
ncbi:MAG: hypothetical protein HON76_16525 [Candidatus Scalindua sp.]|jgi:tetratricopeptide (TPR) repeat protein|nr:hypothetical protein [Candidatus Scalindua sp.]MBT5306716.1 hypothetical protein [Candidatus Scalindua sp.]MBT6049842.1 hypothetical protein [Candidatus Scalindua sp.]MBT6564122.1 hypothetical protein [Candidatus Scalindua sp.]MBT7210851.1 hypothetical protein [Candidatus Scalindua sp.]